MMIFYVFIALGSKHSYLLFVCFVVLFCFLFFLFLYNKKKQLKTDTQLIDYQNLFAIALIEWMV